MITVNLDVMLAKRKVSSKELAKFVDITEQNLSLLKSGKVKGVRFGTLSKICEYLDCQPGDLLSYHKENMGSEKNHEYLLLDMNDHLCLTSFQSETKKINSY